MTQPPRSSRSLQDVVRSVERASRRRQQKRERLEAERAGRRPGEGYELAIVSFIDVLGFRDLLATRHAHDIRDILVHLRAFTQPDKSTLKLTKNARLVSRAFSESVSDAVVRARVFDTEYRDGAFFQELLDLLHAQIQCLRAGVLIRAGVAIGDVHVGRAGKGPVFGPAMVRAYRMEEDEVVQPRIGLDQAAYDRFLADDRLHNEGHSREMEAAYVDDLLRIDTDGMRFIDYLTASESEFDHPAAYFDFLNHHANLVRNNLGSTSGGVRAKYEWLAAYHNSVARQILDEFESGSRSRQEFSVETGCDPITFLQALFVEL